MTCLRSVRTVIGRTQKPSITLITMPGQQPSGLVLSQASEMQLKLDQRRYDVLGGALAETAVDLKNETSFPENLPEEDWVARYIESASQVTDERMQELWGRIMGGQIRTPGMFSLRTLQVVSNLTQFEAYCFEAFGKQVVRWKWFGFVLIVDSEFLMAKAINASVLRILADCGLASETPIQLKLMGIEAEDGAFAYGQNRMVFVRQKSPVVTVPQHCWTLTTAGLQLLELIEREAAPENMKLLVDIFRRFGLEPEVGSYVKKEGNQMGFTSDRERDGNSVGAEQSVLDRKTQANHSRQVEL